MQKATRTLPRLLGVSIVLLMLLILPGEVLASPDGADKPLDQGITGNAEMDGWVELENAVVASGDPGREYGLAWDRESVWRFGNADGTCAIVRLNAGRLIPGAILMEYLVGISDPGTGLTRDIYGQVSFTGWDADSIGLFEHYCVVPSISVGRGALGSASEVDWPNLRGFIDTSTATRSINYTFPLEHQWIAFGPVGHLGLSVAIEGTGGQAFEARAQAGAISLQTSTEESSVDAETTVAESPEAPAAPAEEVDDAGETVEPAQAGATDEANAASSAFATPEDTARYFLEAVMVDRDSVKAAKAWSPRIPDMVIQAVVENEIEFFSDRSSDLLQSILSSLQYVTDHVSDTEALVYAVEHDDKTVIGRLELHEGKWLFIGLGYQLDADLNLSAEWKRLAGIE